jgi:hypothetical protein
MIIEFDDEWSPEFTRPGEKKRRLNRPGEDCHLFPDGSVTRDEDKIVAAQRIWKERAYAPGGKMYQITFDNWKGRQSGMTPQTADQK